MAIYQVTPLSMNADAVSASVNQKIAAEDRFELQSRAGWLVNFKGTSVELSGVLGVATKDPATHPGIGSVLIVPVTSYFGRGPTTMWEWLKTKLESQS